LCTETIAEIELSRALAINLQPVACLNSDKRVNLMAQIDTNMGLTGRINVYTFFLSLIVRYTVT